jgi:hypothetical protein
MLAKVRRKVSSQHGGYRVIDPICKSESGEVHTSPLSSPRQKGSARGDGGHLLSYINTAGGYITPQRLDVIHKMRGKDIPSRPMPILSSFSFFSSAFSIPFPLTIFLSFRPRHLFLLLCRGCLWTCGGAHRSRLHPVCKSRCLLRLRRLHYRKRLLDPRLRLQVHPPPGPTGTARCSTRAPCAG